MAADIPPFTHKQQGTMTSHQNRTLFKTTITVWTEDDPKVKKPIGGWVGVLEYLEDMASNDVASCSYLHTAAISEECFHGHGLNRDGAEPFFLEED